MGRYSSKDCVLLVDGFNVLGVNTDIAITVEAITEESTPYGADWEEHKYIGLQRAEVTQEGYFDDAAGSSNDALNEKQGEERIICLGFEGNTIGQKFNGFEGALQTKFTRIGSRGSLHRANAEYNGSGFNEDGKILHALTQRTADGDTKSTPVEHGTDTPDGGTAYLQVTQLDRGGYDDVTIRVLERNGATWATLQEFVDVDATGAQRIEVAGTIEQDLAVEWEFNGTGSDPEITFFVGFVRN